MLWLIGFPTQERWKAFPVTVALADLHTHKPETVDGRGGLRQIMRETEEETSAYPSVLKPEFGQMLLLLGGWNATTFRSCKCRVYMCFMHVNTSKRVCLLHQKHSFDAIRLQKERKTSFLATS